MSEQTVTLAPLPPQPTTFVGRTRELAELASLLADPACRLLSLVGPGGVGKTRLAIELAHRQRDAFADGVAFVALQGVSTAGDVPDAVAAAVGSPLAGRDEPRVELLYALGHRRLLLVLDNVEHVIEAAPLLADLLTGAPGIRVLATSRVALELQQEWRYPLAGLDTARAGATDGAEPSEAERLFVERARRFRPDFSAAAEAAGVARVCRLVEGLPLALELAAAWSATLPSAVIADEIERDLSLLATSQRDVPARHRSMRAVFDHSWRLLGAEERQVFRRLAVFRGGFTREAAAAVADARLAILAALVGKSLLRYEADGRYHLHELLRQYADEPGATTPDDRERVRDRHWAYYLELLAEQGTLLNGGGGQREALATIAADLENIRVAWQRAIDRMDNDAIVPAVDGMAGFYQYRGRYREGLDVIERAVDCLREAPPSLAADLALAAARTVLALLQIRVGHFAEARVGLEAAHATYARTGAPLPAGIATDPDFGLGLLALIDGDHANAGRLGEAVRQRAAAEQHASNLSCGWYLLAQAALARGAYETAHRAAEHAHAITLRLGDDWFRAYCLNDLGTASAELGDLDQARAYYRASFALREEFGDAEGMALALAHLGRIAGRRGDVAEARTLYERSLTLYQDTGDRGGLAAAHRGLAIAATDGGGVGAAREHFGRALRVVGEIGFVPLALSVATDVADLFLRSGRIERAVEALVHVRGHPACGHETRERAERLLSQAEPLLSAEAWSSAVERGEAIEPAVLLARLEADLAIADDAVTEAPPMQGNSLPLPDQTLVDPLTERELAVLRLIAAGHSNRQIADELFVTVSTVKWHAGEIFGKLQVRNRTGAVSRARQLGLLG